MRYRADLIWGDKDKTIVKAIYNNVNGKYLIEEYYKKNTIWIRLLKKLGLIKWNSYSEHTIKWTFIRGQKGIAHKNNL